jgi:N-acetylmuramoyl-L-alanine amidase
MDKRWVGCAGSNFRPGRTVFRPEAIVIHLMAGSLRGTDLWFASPTAGVSAHYGIGKTGEVHQYVKEEDTAFHAGTVDDPTWTAIRRTAAGGFVNPNLYTIGIEHEGFENDDWPEPMVAASSELIAEVAGRWQIPLDREHIVKHHEIRRVKPCPGKAPVEELIRRAAAAGPAVQSSLMEVSAVSNLNVRASLPSTLAPVRRVVPRGTRMTAAGFIATGQSISGNPCWYRDPAGDFFWAGATDRPNPAA